jgi:hypothetical protein
MRNGVAAYTEAEFIELAKSWSENIEKLQSLRYQLRGRMQH